MGVCVRVGVGEAVHVAVFGIGILALPFPQAETIGDKGFEMLQDHSGAGAT